MENNNFNEKAYFGKFGGQYVPENAIPALRELEEEYEKVKNDKEFQEELKYLLKNYVGRETPLFYAKNLSDHYGHDIYLKREDLNHTGAHKINNALGQVLLAKRMGKKKIIAETGAGQHGVATATAAALMGLECDIYMGAVDIERQKLNVFRMELLGARVVSVEDGLKTLNEAVDAAIQAWIKEIENVFYVLGSAVGPHPYPKMVRDFQSVIGTEAKQQIESLGKHADHVIACVGGGSNAIGIFSGFLDDETTKLYGIEAAGHGIDTDMHAATLTLGKEGIIHGMNTYVLQDENGEVSPVYSISAGLDYPGVGPEHAYLCETGRVSYAPATDKEALDALILTTRKEGIIPAIESAHALAYLEKLCPTLSKDRSETIIVNVSGRGDKDMHTVFSILKGENVNE
jgi:tryptophan synthase, beta subunit